ncbi:MAG: TetR/AcrR family transcriptional regulator [Acholeplasmataceae bacterium]|jgi:AcrR family transcriptional regulator|nr:TetR/AcrR family transcriptional regulator [Acholeplasmataceae bacterium]
MLTTKDKLLSTLVSYIKNGDDLQNIALSKIAQDAEIGKSTVYEYFESKEHMIIETYRYLLKHYASILLSDLEAKDFKGALYEELRRTLIVLKDARSIMEAIMKVPYHDFRVDLSLKREMQDIQQTMSNRFVHIMKLGVEEGILPLREQNKEVSYVVQAIISGLLFQYVNGEMDLTENELLEMIYRQVVRVVQS